MKLEMFLKVESVLDKSIPSNIVTFALDGYSAELNQASLALDIRGDDLTKKFGPGQRFKVTLEEA